jgi:hypothetical protein
VPETLALDGAQILINVSSSPGRDLAAIHEVGLGTAASWRTLMRTYAQLTTSFVVFCNRVGMDETISFWGGSEVIAPSGEAVFTAPLFDEGLHFVDIELGDVRRERIGLPLLRDERPELHLRELRRILAERTGMAIDEASEPGDGVRAEARDRAPGGRRARGLMARCRSRPRDAGEGRPALRAAARARHRHRRRPPGHGRLHPEPARQAGFGRACSGCRAASTRRWWRSWTAEAIGPENLLCVLMPYRTSSPESVEHARLVVDQLGCASDLVDISRSSTATSAVTARSAPAAKAARRRRCGAATSWPGPGCASCTTGRWPWGGSSSAPATRPSR